ncbi:antibiotic biosynthesis monooxygenase family protein [Chitinophaga sp.]|uniref:antibiotic biosynthesis monooxygenase family protein n=1 Tax=Chitinophaga sp. TaxID=1869181 RepID=UPI002F92497D
MKILLAMTMLFLSSTATPAFAQTNSSISSTEIIRYNVPATEHASFEKAYQDAGQYLQASPSCLGYQVIHGNEEPNHYIVIIHWTSQQDHLQLFRKEKNFPAFFNLVKPFYNYIEEMKHYDPTPNQWVRK